MKDRFGTKPFSIGALRQSPSASTEEESAQSPSADIRQGFTNVMLSQRATWFSLLAKVVVWRPRIIDIPYPNSCQQQPLRREEQRAQPTLAMIPPVSLVCFVLGVLLQLQDVMI